MKKATAIICLFLLCLPLSLAAQSVNEERSLDTLAASTTPVAPDSISTVLPLPSPQPLFSMLAPGFDGCSPWCLGTYGSHWDLHEGFNAHLGMSISAGWGKHSLSGVGFGQSAAFAYAMPLNKRFSFSAGLYAQNMDWGAFHQTDVGMAAVLGYKVNDRVMLYGYGTMSLMPESSRQPLGCFPLFMESVRDRIGGMVEFKVGENSSIGFGIEYQRVNMPEAPFYVSPLDGSRKFNSSRGGF